MTFICRDWTQTLWQPSYKGVPFFFEEDKQTAGRSLKAHEFPGADDPFVEDTGRKTKSFSGTAYVSGDDADSQADALIAACDAKGPGTLVLPTLGPVQVHCEECERSEHKDKNGYIAFSLKFVRAGAPAAFTSVPLLGQNVFDGVDGLASAMVGLFSDALILSKVAIYVLGGTIAMVQNVAAALELVRIANPCDPNISASVAAANAAIVQAAPLLIVPGGAADPDDVANFLASIPALDDVPNDPAATLIAAMIANIRRLGDGMAANTDAGAGALLGLALGFPPVAVDPTLAPNPAAAAANVAAVTDVARLAALAAWCEALERGAYASRPDGVEARAAAAERLGNELGNWTGADRAAVYMAIEDLMGAAVAYLTALIADLAPIVTVTAPQSRPALWWAWRLYADPARAVDLVLRNQVTHPSFMPLSFQALAPGFAVPAALPTVWPAAA